MEITKTIQRWWCACGPTTRMYISFLMLRELEKIDASIMGSTTPKIDAVYLCLLLVHIFSTSTSQSECQVMFTTIPLATWTRLINNEKKEEVKL